MNQQTHSVPSFQAMSLGAPMFAQNPMQQQQQFANIVEICYPVNGTWQAYNMDSVLQTMNGNALGQKF